MKRSAFTLVELLIVMAVIAALISVVAPMGLNALKQARTVQVATDLKAVMTDIIGKVAARGTTGGVNWAGFGGKKVGKTDIGTVAKGDSYVTITLKSFSNVDGEYLESAFYNPSGDYYTSYEESSGTLSFSVDAYLYD